MSNVSKTFPNMWQDIHDTPVEMFPEMEYDELLERVNEWLLPSSHCCLMRCENRRTGKITEFSYQSLHHAKNRMVKLAQDEENEILVCDGESIAMFKTTKKPPEPFDLNDPDL